MPMPCHPLYREVARLGAGGMGVVYRVRSVEQGTELALKVLHQRDAALRARLIREGALQGRVEHPNVVATKGLIELADGATGLLMEFVDGPSLAALVAERNLTLPQIDALARQILAGVAAAHAHGLVHRDLKPANILLALRGGGLVPKISDFGIARRLAGEGATRTQAGAVLGTPRYMAPEQLRDPRQVDRRADVFALGTVLYELVTGVSPFGQGSPMEVLARKEVGAFTPPAEHRPELPPRMARAISGALVPEIDGRWPDCEALLDAGTDGTPAPSEVDLWPAELLEGARRRAVADRSLPPTADDLFNTVAPMEAPPPPGSSRRLATLGALGMVASLGAAVIALWSFSGDQALEGEPSILRLSFNPLGRQLLGAALSPDGTALLTAESTGLFLRVELPGSPTELPLPSGLSPAGAVAWCGDQAIAATLRGPTADPGVWWAPDPAGPWRPLLEGAAVQACAWDGSALVAATRSGLVAMDPATGEAHPLQGTEAGYIAQAALSPDASLLAFTRTMGERSTLEVVTLSGDSAPRVLREDALPQSVAWDGEGRLLWLRLRAEETDDRWASLMAQDGPDGEARVVASRIGPTAEALSVSRQGDRISWLTLARQRDLFAYDLGTGTPHPLTNDPAAAFASGWLDEHRLAFSWAPEGRLDLYAQDLREAEPELLLGGEGEVYGLTAIPGTGAWLYTRETASAVELVRREGEATRVLWRSDRTDYLARRNTRCVTGPICLLGVLGEEGLTLSRITPTGLEPVARLATESWRPGGWDLSPDGERVAWTSADGLAVQELSTGAVTRWPTRGDLQEVVWSPDGATLWGTALDVDDEAYALVRIDPTTGDSTVAYADVGWMSHLSVSPTGEALAWTRTTYDVVAWLGVGGSR